MAITPLRILLFLAGAFGAAGGTAYFAGAFDPLRQQASALSTGESASPADVMPEQPAANAAEPELAAGATGAEQDVAAADPAAATTEPESPPPGPVPPAFDLLRVEPDGSIVIAGSALPGSTVEVIAGSKVLAKVETGPEGNFAAVFDEPLKPGDYQIVLRSTGPATVVANSVETAVVSVPQDKSGQVLALVEQPGVPSKLITISDGKPQPTKPAQSAIAQAGPAAQEKPAAPEQQQAATPDAGKPVSPETATVSVEAVEIEDRKIFVAGAAPAGSTVRVYANDQLLGDSRASPEGRFLIETERDLKVGDYIIRADVLGKDGAKVLARAAVPFEREPGESVAAVAASEPSQQPLPGTGKSDSPAEPIETPAVSATAPAAGVTTPVPAAPSATGGAPAMQQQAATDPALQPPAATDPAIQPPAATETAVVSATSTVAATSPKLEAADSGVIIRRGDSLWRISKRVYGHGLRYSTIYLANKDQIRNPDMIWPGQVFRVPGKTDQGEAADMKAIGEQATTVQ